MTFDDGFENNLTIAKPILEKLGIPATVYITSRFIDENGMSWIDRIEYAFETIASGKFMFPWSGKSVTFESESEKIEILKEIRRYVKFSPSLDVDGFVSNVFHQLNLDEVKSSNEDLDQKMTWDQVKSWLSGDFLVGGHSHTHPILSFLKAVDLEYEVDTSLRLMREKAGIVSPHYSYPEGLQHCFSDEVIQLLKSRGVSCCPTAIDGTNGPGADPFHLRRVMVS